MKRKHIIYFILIICLGFTLVKQEQSYGTYVLKPPPHFPFPQIPIDNQLTISRVELGKKLFFDPIMSRDNTVSCATCHKPNLAFTDGLIVSKGIRGQMVDRNAPTLANIAYHDSGLLHDSGVPTLEMQVLVPVQEHKEFDFDMKLIAERLKKDSNYVFLSKKAYNSVPTPFVITRAISAFERTLISGNSKYDQYVNGDTMALSESERRGMYLFFNELNCSNCHNGFNFTNLSLQNNGLYDTKYPLDSGRMRITHLESDRDLFKVPTLRNIEVTAPYMHNGSISTLEQVINHYATGGKDHPNKSDFVIPFQISPEEKKDLIRFLQSLTDSSFINKSY